MKLKELSYHDSKNQKLENFIALFHINESGKQTRQQLFSKP